jgi:hypothetical protein
LPFKDANNLNGLDNLFPLHLNRISNGHHISQFSDIAVAANPAAKRIRMLPTLQSCSGIDFLSNNCG